MGLQVAVIGTGEPEEESTDGYGMAYEHASGYERLDDCELVACADLVAERALAFADAHDIDSRRAFEDAETMLDETEPDVVSVCVPPAAHADLVVTCANHGAVDAVHCEKPMAATWAECQRMVDTCAATGTQLTINHQRRFASPFRRAKDLVDEGRIGDLRRIEVGGQNLYDYGTHLFDMCGYLTDQTPVEWVLAQVSYRESDVQFGMHNENQALARWRYENGVEGFASTGEDGLVDCQLRLLGSEGAVEVGRDGGPPLRVRVDGSGWEEVDTGKEGIYVRRAGTVAVAVNRVLDRTPLDTGRVLADPTYVERSVAEAVEALRAGREPEHAGWKALQSTEVIFACWESARRRGRVSLPLDISDNPLEAMVESGRLLGETEGQSAL
jgi:predicted dehydrogenase